MNEKTKFFIRYKHEQSRSAWNAFDATLAWITLKLARLKVARDHAKLAWILTTDTGLLGFA